MSNSSKLYSSCDFPFPFQSPSLLGPALYCGAGNNNAEGRRWAGAAVTLDNLINQSSCSSLEWPFTLCFCPYTLPSILELLSVSVYSITSLLKHEDKLNASSKISQYFSHTSTVAIKFVSQIGCKIPKDWGYVQLIFKSPAPSTTDSESK